MNDLSVHYHPLLFVGLALLVILAIRLFVRTPYLPPVVLYIGCGMLASYYAQAQSLPAEWKQPFDILGDAGLVMLLFNVGMQADLKSLKEQLPNASWIGLWNVLVSGGLTFAATRYWLEYDLLTSLFVSVAFTATSVGISVSVWQDAGRLHSKEGNLLLDITELDDLSTICLVAVLVSLVPFLHTSAVSDWVHISILIGEILLLLTLFAVVAAFFSLVVEPRLTHFIAARAIDHELVMLMLGVGFIAAALAEVSGLSLAIGAFVVGLAFSRDDGAMQEQPVIKGLYDFLTPFFFIALGMIVTLTSTQALLIPLAILSGVAIAGKLLGVTVAAWPRFGLSMALILGVSMVPRMEIAMVVMRKGVEYGVDQAVFNATILAALITVVFSLAVLPTLLRK